LPQYSSRFFFHFDLSLVHEINSQTKAVCLLKIHSVQSSIFTFNSFMMIHGGTITKFGDRLSI